MAQTIEQARYAASLVQVSYAPELAILTMDDATKAKKPKKKQDESIQLHKGDVEPALTNQDIVQVHETYSTPTETHNPIETSGTIAAWEGDDKLTVWDATQFVKGVQSILARSYGLKIENVRVICPFVGGAFGCKGARLAARSPRHHGRESRACSGKVSSLAQGHVYRDWPSHSNPPNDFPRRHFER